MFLQPEPSGTALQGGIYTPLLISESGVCVCVCVLPVYSARAACGRSIIFPPSLERLGFYNLLVSQAHLLSKSGQRVERGDLQPGLRARGRILMQRSRRRAGRA